MEGSEAEAAVAALRAEVSRARRELEARVGEALRLCSPLGPALAQAQRDTRDLRQQVEALAQQVAALARHHHHHQHQSLEEQKEEGGGGPDPQRRRSSGGQTPLVENGPSAEDPPGHDPGSAPERRAHLPVTAVTKGPQEAFKGETHGHSSQEGPRDPAHTEGSPPSQIPLQARMSSSAQKSPAAPSERSSSGTKSVPAVGSESSPAPAPPLNPGVKPQAERRKELVRSQTLPRTSGSEARKALLEKFDRDSGGGRGGGGGRGRGGGRPKLQRSQSLGVTSASGIKQILLEWCRSKTIGYKHIDLQNFSSSWSDGMGFCALVHSFFPEAFDYEALQPGKHRQNLEAAFSAAEKMAGCDRLIEVEDMLAMGRKPDPMCVFTYVQSLYNHLRRFE